jgi:diguanylate cyclase (GGDEF)-like protein
MRGVLQAFVAVWLWVFCGPLAALAADISLDDQHPEVNIWPGVTVLSDPGKQLTLAEARQRVAEFTMPTTADSTLGQRRDAVWLRVPLMVSEASDGRWVFDVNYAVLNRMDVYLLGPDGNVLQQSRLGNTQLSSDRPMPSRSHAVQLQFQPGNAHELWLRVETMGGMIVPMTLSKDSTFLARALHEQMLQGLLVGLGLCLICYSLAQWLTLREALLLKYAVLIGGGVLFSIVQFGIGVQFIWVDVLWFEMHLAPLAALMAAAGMSLFVEEALREPEQPRWFGAVMKGIALFLALVGSAFAVGWIDVNAVSKVIGTVGLAPALLGLPGAIRRVRRGDSVGWYFIVAWVGYFIATAIMVLLIRGVVPATSWTLHSFQIGATLDMLLFLRVLALRLNAVHELATRTAHERDHALNMAATDALTGLPNRRGLQSALSESLSAVQAAHITALYLIDLDGFKPVNDEFGHEVGDHLLIAVSDRLRQLLRGADVVARLGGDEFVVLAKGLTNEEHARQLGEELLAAFELPFDLGELSVWVGASIGYALAPMDGSDPKQLMQRADAAMYEGKRQGKQQLTRI